MSADEAVQYLLRTYGSGATLRPDVHLGISRILRGRPASPYLDHLGVTITPATGQEAQA